MKNLLGIILARKGSKRLPGKNKKLLNGIPLIEYTIKAALESNVFKTIIVSTDDEDIVDICFGHKCKIFARPDHLKGDDVRSEDVILDIINTVEILKYDFNNYDKFILLQPTSPLRTPEDIQNALIIGGDCTVSINSAGKYNGAIYICGWEKFKKDKKFVPDTYYPMPEYKSIDIDTLEDFKKCEDYLKNIEGDIQ